MFGGVDGPGDRELGGWVLGVLQSRERWTRQWPGVSWDEAGGVDELALRCNGPEP